MIDLNLISQGQDYEQLKKSYVIFICLKDIFGQNKSVYTFENTCLEVPGLKLNDETTKIFLNASGDAKDISPKLASFLKFVSSGITSDTYTKKLKGAVEKGKNNDEWRAEYMAYYDEMKRCQAESLKEGETRGIKKGEEKKAKEMAISLAKQNVPVEVIASSAKVSVDTVKNWITKNKCKF